MNWGGPAFIIAIVAITTLGWVISTAIRARYGYPIENEWGGMTERADSGATKALADENKALRDTVEKLENRIKTLERIATDPAKRLESEIDSLR